MLRKFGLISAVAATLFYRCKRPPVAPSTVESLIPGASTFITVVQIPVSIQAQVVSSTLILVASTSITVVQIPGVSTSIEATVLSFTPIPVANTFIPVIRAHPAEASMRRPAWANAPFPFGLGIMLPFSAVTP
jgi:hypothetical protein